MGPIEFLLIPLIFIISASGQTEIDSSIDQGLPSSSSVDCLPPYMSTFELVTGYVFSSADDTMETISGVLQLTECLSKCGENVTCRSVNFETGLCVLLRSDASIKPESLQPSQFPVFTIYAQKSCLKGLENKSCLSSWSFEKVIGYELRKYEKRRLNVTSKNECLEACLLESSFKCRSVNYDNGTGECSLSDIDRHAIPTKPPRRDFAPSISSPSQTIDYYESNCIEEPKTMCSFQEVKGKVLKTVDSIHPNINTTEECEKACLNAIYRCFSYDLGEPKNGRVCRTSHLESVSLTHIEEPHSEVPDAITYERGPCYKLKIDCRAKEMIASIQTTKLFNGKVYAKAKPTACVNDVTNQLDFDLAMPYHDILCDVKQKEAGTFANDIVIQHHDMVVTTKDMGLSVNCNYDLSNKSVTNQSPISIEADELERDEANVHSQVVGSPNITMRVVDKDGNDITSAQVGDSLTMRFSIDDPSSPYKMFIRELVAVDGMDVSDILLIDGAGCPVDINIMGFVSKVEAEGTYYLDVPFDAFKFPTSDIVQFRALVTPCLTGCAPVPCVTQTADGKVQERDSYGRRRRRRRSAGKTEEEKDLLMTQSIKITDVFELDGKQRPGDKNRNSLGKLDESDGSSPNDYFLYTSKDGTESVRNIFTGSCINMAGFTIACGLFLVAQLIMLVVWACCWQRKINSTYNSSNFCDKRRSSSSTLPSPSYIYSYGGPSGTLPNKTSDSASSLRYSTMGCRYE
ncbi:uncharacterized protein LOC107368149 [Tetranychus urticae]|uniref:ZP domain-containing protein n=1 Tax=Tetranychus urticae TaxID=32264 RepID=T1KXB8_TETUR|nr:uncharacterized protein LOC107368149 [Tetranychus urticae]